MAMNIDLVPTKALLTIGDDYAKANTIEFKITLSGGDSKFKLLSLQIPVGENGILKKAADANNIKIAPKESGPTSSSDSLTWVIVKSRDGIPAGELSVKIENILCNAKTQGSSKLSIIGETKDKDPNSVTKSLDIEIKEPKTAVNPILYFTADPTYLIGSGPVNLEWYMAGGNQDATLDTKKETGKKVTSPTTDTPSKPWIYTLKVGSKQRQVAVNVLSEGWDKIQPLGDAAFPSVIFDSGGRTNDALYTIFVRPSDESGRQAVLCKSADGITGWQVINDTVPPGMESSPGVLLGKRLWLIGGSAVDPKNKSTRICYYDLGAPLDGWKDVVPGNSFEERMGHACVIVDDNTIWVMGGLDRYHTCLNDVLRLTIPQTGGTVSASKVESMNKFTPRCMFSAVNFYNMIWVCGGVNSPNGKSLGDVWASASSPINWQKRLPPKDPQTLLIAGAIGTGAAITGSGSSSTLFTVYTRPAMSGMQAMMSKLDSNEVYQDDDGWNASVAPTEGWTTSPHSVALVAFKSRLYLRFLHRDAMYGDVVGASLHVYVNSQLLSRD